MTQVKEFLIGVGSVMDLGSTRLQSTRPTFIIEENYTAAAGLHRDWVAVGESLRWALNENNYVSK